jgi:hypothetical protein
VSRPGFPTEQARSGWSVSMTCTFADAQPSRSASPASPYWRIVYSVCSRTCAIEDWRW